MLALKNVRGTTLIIASDAHNNAEAVPKNVDKWLGNSSLSPFSCSGFVPTLHLQTTLATKPGLLVQSPNFSLSVI